MIQADLNIILPEVFLSVFAMLALVGTVYTSKDRLGPLLVWLTAGIMALVALAIASTGSGETQVAFGGMFVDDGFARFAKVTILFSAAAVLVMSEDYMSRNGLLRFEYPLLVVLAVVGMMVMVSAGDLMALYMGLELQSLALYVIASLRRDSLKSTEAGLKYFVLGALSSGLLLYGASLCYGYSGTTLFTGIVAATAESDISVGLLLGLVMISAGLAFKVSAVPFHMWTPDVYEGAPTPVTAFFATAPKVAAIGLFARVLHDAFGNVVGDWQQIIAAFIFALDVFGCVCSDWANKHKTFDGLFFNRSYGICAYGLGCWHGFWIASLAHLHGHLRHDEYWNFRVYSFDAKRWKTGHGYCVFKHVIAQPAWQGLGHACAVV
jgi:NADH-quinone oxidoreductase subunit N